MSIRDFDFIREKAQTHGKELAFVDEAHEVSFRELDLYTRKIAHYLHSKGLKPGQLVATLLPTYLDYHFTFALQRLGITTMSKNNFSNFSPEATPDWLITIKAHSNFPTEKTMLLDAEILTGINDGPEDGEVPGYANPSDLARLASTSGTTGRIKYISISAEDLDDLAVRKSSYDLAGLDHVLSMYPFGSGQTYGLALKNLLAGKTYYSCFFTDHRLAKMLRTYPIRTLIGSPAQIAAFLDVQTQTGTQLPILKTIIMGGSPPSQPLINRIKAQLDCQIYNAYGSSEAGNISIEEITSHADGLHYAGTIMHSDVTLQIVDENDAPVPAGEVGIVRYRRPEMATSYYKNPAAATEFFKDGFFYPGDLGYLDSEGRLVLQGRINEVINLGGVKMNPEVIDKLALAQLGVVDCATFVIPGPTGVEQLALALVTDSDFIPEHFEKAMAKKSPFPIAAVLTMSSIARNENGKIMRTVLTQQYLSQIRP